MTPILLEGLEGTNPLAFLAALGVLVALDEARGDGPAPRLSWQDAGGWRPVIHSVHESIETLVAALDADRESCKTEPALLFTYAKVKESKGKPTKVEHVEEVKPPPADLRKQLLEWLADTTASDRRTLDWFTSFVSEGAFDNNGAAKPSPLHFVAGQQKFLTSARKLVAGVTPAALEAALIGPWAYDSSLPVLRWDNTETRDYALRASDPAKEKLGNPGADWLALRGLSMLTTTPHRRQQGAPGAYGSWKGGGWRWALWEPAVTRRVAQSVLGWARLGRLTVGQRRRLGVAMVLQTRILRSDQGGYGSVLPAKILAS